MHIGDAMFTIVEEIMSQQAMLWNSVAGIFKKSFIGFCSKKNLIIKIW